MNCWKTHRGQSAAKIYSNVNKVQRLGYGILIGKAKDGKNPRAQRVIFNYNYDIVWAVDINETTEV